MSQDDEYSAKIAKMEIVNMLNTITEGESVDKLLQKALEEKAELENQIKEEVTEYFQSLKVCESLVEKSTSGLKVVQANFKDFDKSVQKSAWANSPSLFKLVTLRKNLSQVVDTLHDFLNVSSQMKNLRELMKESRNYEVVQKKLLTICSLRDSMMSKSVNNKKLEQTFKNFSERFKEIRVLEEEFYNLIYANVEESLELVKKDLKRLTRSLKVVETADLANPKAKDGYFKRAQDALKAMVKNRFESRLTPDAELADKLEVAKTSVDDLMDTHQLLVPVFPAKYGVFEFVRREYKGLIEDLVRPIISDLEAVKKDPGVIIYLISWLDGYEVLLKRAGIEEAEHAELKEVVSSEQEAQRVHAAVPAAHPEDRQAVAQQDARIQRGRNAHEQDPGEGGEPRAAGEHAARRHLLAVQPASGDSGAEAAGRGAHFCGAHLAAEHPAHLRGQVRRVRGQGRRRGDPAVPAGDKRLQQSDAELERQQDGDRSVRGG